MQCLELWEFLIRIMGISDLHLTGVVRVLVTQSCPTLCNPIDCSLPGSSVHGILQARILGWVASPLSRGSSQPRDRTGSPALQVDSLPAEPPAKSSHLGFVK